MLYVMLLAHLIGDYLLQTSVIVRWKTRSILGVLAHGMIVTLVTLAGAVWVDWTWWPYALLIGLSHTLVDVVRARFIRTSSVVWELLWYLFDQAVHLGVIWGVVQLGTAALPPSAWDSIAVSVSSRILVCLLGYLLLLNPSWVLLRFVVRGIWGPEAAPGLDQGEKYGPMLERVLIATGVLFAQFSVVPLVLIIRRVSSIRVHGTEVGVSVHQPEHWAETLLSTLLAVGVGFILRWVGA